nr:methyltransferase domain-containing protein [Bifidobacterium castoris]
MRTGDRGRATRRLRDRRGPGGYEETLPFEDESFDLIINPVSNCYIEQLRPVFRECFRVLNPAARSSAAMTTASTTSSTTTRRR